MNVIRHILRNRILIILLLIIVWSVISESPFQKGGVRANMHYIIYFINVVLSFVYILPFLKNKISYKIGVIISFIFSFIGLLIGLLSTEYILEIIDACIQLWHSLRRFRIKLLRNYSLLN